MPTASIVINNFDYERFLGAAIESALGQTHRAAEVIVVDDGSRDGSRDLIARYEPRVSAVLKDNGGQASALNAGFARAAGDVVVFLDADDVLAPTAVERAVVALADPGVVKAHWPLWEIDGDGRRLGGTAPSEPPADGDLLPTLLRDGPAAHVNPPMSGNAWARRYLDRVMPVPEDDFRTWADVYLLELAPLYGRLARVDEPQGCYRLHGANRYAGTPFEDRLERGVALYGRLCDTLADHAARVGARLDAEDCRARSWFHRVEASVRDIERLVPEKAPFILVDEDEWGTGPSLRGRRRLPFPERDGAYWGRPADGPAAVAELERTVAASGARTVVFAWPAFWWLEHYRELREHLDASARRVAANERLVAYALGRTSAGGTPA